MAGNHRWVEDSITRLNGNGALYYMGGWDGVYMRLSPDSKLMVGTYEGAIPHIGEAAFPSKMERQYDDINGAFEAACQIGGKRFLVDMLSLDAVPQIYVHDDEPGMTFEMAQLYDGHSFPQYRYEGCLMELEISSLYVPSPAADLYLPVSQTRIERAMLRAGVNTYNEIGCPLTAVNSQMR